MRRRVVITGMGAITPLGHSVEELFRAQVEGQSGVGPIFHFNARRFPTQFQPVGVLTTSRPATLLIGADLAGQRWLVRVVPTASVSVCGVR